ncbi:MAG: endonuclease [Saprospiraceae bacterium]|nr:endonuclease [Saprospiraceae bacterium]
MKNKTCPASSGLPVSILISTLFLSLTLTAQEIIFPGLRGDSLTTEIKKYYTPKKVLKYDDARTKLYNEIFLHKDTLECFYSGYKIPVPIGTNILSWTARYGIQTEHLFPRSLGSASMPALGDLHHLVPARATINTLRKNSPFQDIPDDQTKYWIYKDKVLNNIPRTQIHIYSEYKSNAFEPLEKRKGDIVRSIFYFYTLYKSASDKKSKTFFTSMLPDLCRWHRSDKVDSTEILRSLAIARIQSNVNPFIFDPSLAERCYCAAYPPVPEKSYSINIYPNPSKGLFYIDLPDYKGPIIMSISDHSGKLLETHHLMYSGVMSWRLGKGIWIINFSFGTKKFKALEILIK